MGCAQSSEEEGEDKESKVLKYNDIYFDKDGNLRVGHKVHNKTREEKEKELRDILNVEEADDLEAEDVIWYVMDAAWIASWLAYVHYETDTTPYPGPCRNDRLLVADRINEKWVPRPRLVMASKRRAGDYRRVSRKTWELYCKYYPGSGPTITMIFKKDDAFKESGLYDTSSWDVIDYPYVDDDPNPKKRKSQLLNGEEAKNGYNEKDQSELMEDAAITAHLRAQMAFLGTRAAPTTGARVGDTSAPAR